MKICSKCSNEKPLTEFYKRGDGTRNECKECTKVRVATWKDNNREWCREYRRQNYAASPEKHREQSRRKYAKDPERYAEIKKRYEDRNKESVKQQRTAWKKANKHKLREDCANRRAIKAKATPTWADRNKIQEIYSKCPPGYEVDHVIPLRGKNVCGLHCEDNLQHLPAEVNRKKSNKLLPLDPAYPTAWDQWAKKHEQAAKRAKWDD